MKNKNVRKVDTSQMPVIADSAVLGNHYLCLCNGKTDVTNEDWNKKGWDVEFHIPDNGGRYDKTADLRKSVNKETCYPQR